MLSNGDKILVILGPTCTGKSELSLRLAEEFGGEIVNADSMQVYKHFNIGTAKPDIALMNKIPHHLIDVVEPDEEFNASIFKEKADIVIRNIIKRGKLPVFVGGTGLYLRVLLYGLFPVPKETGLREAITEEYLKNPMLFHEKLKTIDVEYAKKIGFRDKIRAVRAMEVFNSTGIRMSEWQDIHGFKKPHYDALKIGLKKDRNELYARINRRVEDMLDAGWIKEVEGILSMGYNQKEKPFSGIGYREILLFVNGVISYEDMVKEIKKRTRNYAKRQFTWFAREKDINWYTYPEETDSILSITSRFLK